MRKDLYIFGAGYTAKQVYFAAKKTNIFNIKGFVISDKYYEKNTLLYEIPIISYSHLLCKDSSNFLVFVAISWKKLNVDRQSVFDELKKKNFKFANIISTNAIIQENTIIGENCWIEDNVVVSSGAVVGDNTFLQSSALLLHDTNIGNNCFIAAGSVIGGFSIVGENCFLGLNSIIFHDIKISRKCIIGGGVVIKRDVSEFTLVKSSECHHFKFKENEIEQKLK